jgi:hypothetical protein
MQDSFKREIVVALSVVVVATILIFVIPQPTGKVYNCSLSEISPDYPLEVKEECRRLRAEMSDNKLHKPK